MTTAFARAIEGIPVVTSAGDRDTLYPAPTLDQRVQLRSTGEYQRYDGVQWVTDFTIAATAKALTTPRAINGLSFDGSGDITAPAAAASLTGPTLAANVVNSSLVTLGVLLALNVSGVATLSGTVSFSQSARVLQVIATAGSGAILDGYLLQMSTTSKALNLGTTTNVGDKLVLAYYDTSGAVWRSALDVACTNGLATLNLLPAGGTVAIGGALSVTGGISGSIDFTNSARTLRLQATAGSGSIIDGYLAQMITNGKALNLATTSNVGDRLILSYRDTSGAVWRAAVDVACTVGLAQLELMAAGGKVAIGSSGAADLIVAAGGAALATAATAGFLFLSSMAGTPTGAAAGPTGSVPFVVDTTALKLWARIAGTWRFAQLT